ncbi:MAG: GTPase ObgE, partial [Candidatus Rokubacteria bacterium]|nr:GTPase ObgE [Candidatus Rokubacteria bacterium]
ERTRLLVHLLDLDPSSGRDPLDDLGAINAELRAYSESLAERPQIVVANKIDLPEAAARVEALRDHCARAGLPFYAISAATGRGLTELLRGLAATLEGIGWARAAS